MKAEQVKELITGRNNGIFLTTQAYVFQRRWSRNPFRMFHKRYLQKPFNLKYHHKRKPTLSEGYKLKWIFLFIMNNFASLSHHTFTQSNYFCSFSIFKVGKGKDISSSENCGVPFFLIAILYTKKLSINKIEIILIFNLTNFF